MTPEAIITLREQCLKYGTRTELMYGNPNLYQRIKRAGLENLCFVHMPVHRRVWTIEEMVREAKKYRTRSEMLAENPGLYQALRRRGLTHLLPPSKQGQKQ